MSLPLHIWRRFQHSNHSGINTHKYNLCHHIFYKHCIFFFTLLYFLYSISNQSAVTAAVAFRVGLAHTHTPNDARKCMCKVYFLTKLYIKHVIYRIYGIPCYYYYNFGLFCLSCFDFVSSFLRHWKLKNLCNIMEVLLSVYAFQFNQFFGIIYFLD